MEWTDDMTVRLAPGTSVQDVVRLLRHAGQHGTPRREVLGVLTEHFALPFDDARLAMDRVAGGIVRAASGNPANEPDPVKDPLAWASYRIELGLPVDGEAAQTAPAVREAADALVEGARRGEATRGTDQVAVALEVARRAVAMVAQEPGPIRLRLLLEAATCLSVAAEARIAGLRGGPCAKEGSPEWVDGVALAEAAREVTARFAAQPDPELEERGLMLVGRIVTCLMGQSAAFVGRVMLDSARCIQRNGDPNRAASHVEPVLTEFAWLLDRFEVDPPFDEHVLALEHLLAAIDLTIEVRGATAHLDALRRRTARVLARC